MESRIGTCGSCQAKFKVPATFTADKAKCRKCGGVVRFETSAAPVSTAKPVPARAPAPTATTPAAPAPAPVVARPAATATAKPSVAASPVATQAKRAPAPPAPEPVAPAPTATRNARRSNRRYAEKPKSPAFIAGGAMVCVLCLVGIFFLLKKGDEQPALAAGGGTKTAGAAQQPPAGEAPQPSAPEAPPPALVIPKPAKNSLPDQTTVVDLVAELPELPPPPGIDAKRLAELQGMLDEYLAPFSGSAGARAGIRLAESPKEAFPLILNNFRKLDFATQDGFQAGLLSNKLLGRICAGKPFNWKHPPSVGETLPVKDVIFNQRVVRKWYAIWLDVKDDEAKWNALTGGPDRVKESDDF